MKIKFAVCSALLSLLAHADITVDMTNSTVGISAPDTVQLNNVYVPGYGNYSLQFKWSPSVLGFVYQPNTLQAVAAASCARQSYPLNNSYSGTTSIFATSRVTNGAEFGAITDITPEGLENSALKSPAAAFPYYYNNSFVVAWARTATQAANPYLNGHTIPNFDPTKGYGYVTGTDTSGNGIPFDYGDIVEIVGSPQSGNTLAIKQVYGNRSLLLSNGTGLAAPSTNANCAPSGSGKYLATSQGPYAISITGDSAFIANVGGYNFQASWSVSSGVGVASQTPDSSRNSQDYTNFGGIMANDKLLVEDVGNGFTFTSLDANGKVLAGTAFFLKYYPY